MAAFIGGAAASFGLSTAPFVVLSLGLLFLTGGLICMGGVFASRIVKSRRARRAQRLGPRYQKVLNKIIVNETFSDGAPDAAFEYYMAELRLIAGASSFSRQLLLTQALQIKKSLTGKSANALVKMYYEMSLYRESLRKLNGVRWHRKALAVRELAEMGYREGAPRVAKFLHSCNRTLQQESLMALVRLEDQPLAFLNHYKGELSLWMRINIYRYLQHQTDHRKLPLFSQYFDHPSLSVRLFCVSMTRRFKQAASVPGLVDMLHSEHPQLVGIAVSALGELEAFQCKDEVAKLAMQVWHLPKLCKRVMQCLGSIGDEEDIELIGRFLDHPSYSVRFEAVSALRASGAPGEQFLERFSIAHHDRIDSILRHFAEPLLN